MPKCPDYFSAHKLQVRKRIKTKLKAKKQNELAKAIHLSLEQSEQQQKQNHCETLQDIKQKIILQSPWKLVKHENSLSICKVTHSENVGPKISKTIRIDDTLVVTAFMQSVKLTTLNQHQFPLKTEYLSKITNFCDELASFAYTLNLKDMDGSFTLRLNLILSLLITLKSDNFKFCNVVDFVYEKLRLLAKDKINYGYEFQIFSTLFYNLSPHAYRFLLRSGNLIQPCYNTIRRITLSSSMSPSVEQTDTTFVYSIKQKFRCLDPSDATVLLLVDEIHLKQYLIIKEATLLPPRMTV